MKNKHFGFTLIELLVVIVIIGILATISTATFKKYFGKARDAARNTSVANITLMIKVDGADKWDDTKYVYDLAALQALFDQNDYRIPRAENNLCYLIGLGAGEDPVGDDNEFFVATWGEETSSPNPTGEGIIVDGTEDPRTLFIDDAGETSPTVTKNSFVCTTDPSSGAVTWTNTDSAHTHIDDLVGDELHNDKAYFAIGSTGILSVTDE